MDTLVKYCIEDHYHNDRPDRKKLPNGQVTDSRPNIEMKNCISKFENSCRPILVRQQKLGVLNVVKGVDSLKFVTLLGQILSRPTVNHRSSHRPSKIGLNVTEDIL